MEVPQRVHEQCRNVIWLKNISLTNSFSGGGGGGDDDMTASQSTPRNLQSIISLNKKCYMGYVLFPCTIYDSTTDIKNHVT
jgi:hypothetical protein